MKKIIEGKYEILTSKEDAIDKFVQLQGACVEGINGGVDSIEFTCTKKGKMFIGDITKRRRKTFNSTKLYAQNIEENGKTYVSYFTSFSGSVFVFNLINIILLSLMSVGFTIFTGIYAIETKEKPYLPVMFCLFSVCWILEFISKLKEKKNSQKDSEIMIKELEKRIEAVNKWDK